MTVIDKTTTFLGYRRENGRVGVRNHVIILPLDDLSNSAAEAVAHNIKGAMAIPHSYGRLQFGADLDLHFRTVIGTGCNPNVAAVVVIGIEDGWTQKVVDGIKATGKPVVGFGIEQAGGRPAGGVEGLGAGDLGSRVQVQGRDEVAALAAQFNRAADRIEALVAGQRRMFASASHELRSPLARLRMAVELLADAAPQQHALASEAGRDIEELDALVGDLLLSSRLEARPDIAHTPVDLAAIVADEATRAGATDLSSGTAELRGDPAALRRLIRNLLENARAHGQPPIEITVDTTATGLRIVVEDRGPGVPEAERERIFEAFYRPAGHREGDGGVGLGLALVRQIAALHGGVVRCEARPGGGSRFVAELPRG